MPLEFEEEGAGVRFELRVSIRREHQIIEQFRIEKPGIQLAGLCAIPSLLRVGRDRDLLPDLEAHFKVFRDLIQIAPKLIRRWWAIKGGVVADRTKAGLTVVEILAVLA